MFSNSDVIENVTSLFPMLNIHYYEICCSLTGRRESKPLTAELLIQNVHLLRATDPFKIAKLDQNRQVRVESPLLETQFSQQFSAGKRRSGNCVLANVFSKIVNKAARFESGSPEVIFNFLIKVHKICNAKTF